MARDAKRNRWPGESGQASVALVAAVPALILVALTMAQFALAGHAALSAASAARAAARASYAGTDVEDAARGALPQTLREGMAVRVRADRTEVEVRVPRPLSLPFMPRIPVTASALLGPAGGTADG